MIHLHSLGKCEIELGDTRLMPNSRTFFAAALYLAIEGKRPVEREHLLRLLWPDSDDDKANHALRQLFYRMRSHGVTLRVDGERVVLPSGLVTTDYDALLAPAASCPVDQMLTRIPGGFLPGYMPRISRPYAEWVEGHRERVNAVLRRQLVSGIKTLRAAGDWPATQALAQRCLELDPLNEEATLAYAEAMAMDGSKARAIRVIDRYMNEIGPRATELYLPATTLKKRIADLYPLPPVIEKEPPQIGREEEMEKLGAALTDARQGRGSAFLISGPPGMGKTRLVTEFTRAAHLKGILVARSQMGRHDDHRPLGAWSDLVPLLQKMPGALGCDPESLPFLARLTTYDSKRATPGEESQNAEYVFARIRMAILDLVGAVANESCVILVIEDVHWMDEWSWDVVSAFSKRLDRTGVLILMTRRDAEAQATPIPADAALRMLALQSLAEASRYKLLDALAPAPRAGASDFARWCVKSCAGNPYFLIELARRASDEGGKFQAPPSLTRLIADRFLGVAPLSRRVLEVAAILGKHSTLARIEEVLSEERVSLLDGLDELSRHSLISTEGDRVLCRHELLGVSALGDISPESLQLLHRHVARVLEPDRGCQPQPGLLWDCAEHWSAGGERDRAVAVFVRCATSAIDTGTPIEAARAYKSAHSLLPESPDRDLLQRRRLYALHEAREHDQLMSAVAADGLGQANTRGASMPRSEEELYHLDAELYARGPSRDLLARALDCAADTKGPSQLRVEAGLIALKTAFYRCDRQAADRVRETVMSVHAEATTRLAAEFRMVLEGSVGSLSKSVAEARSLLAWSTEHERGAARARTLLQCAVPLIWSGQLDAAMSAHKQARDLAIRFDLPSIVLATTMMTISVVIAAGDLDGAELLINWLSEFKTPLHHRVHNKGVVRDMARLALIRGDLSEAKRHLGQFETIWGGEYPREAHLIAELRARYLMRAREWIPTDADMARLMEMHSAGRQFTAFDGFVVMLAEAHLARREHAAVEPLLTEYLTHHRRERSPLHFELQRLLVEMGIPPAVGSANLEE